MDKTTSKSKQTDEVLKELETLEEEKQKAVKERDSLLRKWMKKSKKAKKGKTQKIPYDKEGGFFKKGKLISNKQVQGIWSRSKEADYRRKAMLLLNLEFRKDRKNIRKALEDNKMRWGPKIFKMVELFCRKYDVGLTDFLKIRPLSFFQSGNITGEDKIFCRDCGRELDLLKHLPMPLTDDSKVRCPFCHRVKRFKEGYFERKRILIIVKKDTILGDIKEAWPEVEFLKRVTFRISFEEKEPELSTNWERDYEWYKLWKFQGKSHLEIAKKELEENEKGWREKIWEDIEREFEPDKSKRKEVEKEYEKLEGTGLSREEFLRQKKEEIFRHKWNNFKKDRVVGETKLEIIIKKAIIRFENNISKVA